MNVSVILCSKNGGPRLERCLAAMSALDAPAETEFVLVDNGSTDGVSLQIMLRFRDACNLLCTVLEVETPGNSAGRNAGIAASDGDLLLFIDDDCYVEADFARQWLSLFRTRNIGFGSGMILKWDPASSDLGINESPCEKVIPARAFVERGFVHGSNMAFRRDCLLHAGLFDARFGAGTPFAGEEWDVALRALSAGWAGGYFPGPKVKHDHQRQGDVARERLLFYDYGAGAVYAKHMTQAAWLSIAARLAREMYRLRKDGKRLGALLRGYRAYRNLSEGGK